MVDDAERREALDRSVRALARRDHSASSLRAKLERAGISAEAQSEALAELERAGYVDDVRFARARAEHLAGRGYGDAWIHADLAARGVETEVAADALATLEPEAERARLLWRKLPGGMRGPQRLARRGFAEETVEALVAARLHTTPAEE